MITDTRPMPAEYLHSSKCLAHALICAVENMRDSHSDALAFRMAVQENRQLSWADEYLASGTADCLCHSWDIAETTGQRQGHIWQATCACGWEGEHHLSPGKAIPDGQRHAAAMVSRAWEAASR